MTLDYASNLTVDQWKLLSTLLPAPKTTGRLRTVNLYEVVNAILSLLSLRSAG
ncbi:transposase [Leptolyngbya sp. PCC 6406]|uniref:transposase n=1 Tax=Leptolyngbya sp. PCC 6406 TaxID=1173264 RepID=UPI0002ABA902|nr:transposase [Leptolyngbya sp. PCC 6406]